MHACDSAQQRTGQINSKLKSSQFVNRMQIFTSPIHSFDSFFTKMQSFLLSSADLKKNRIIGFAKLYQ